MSRPPRPHFRTSTTAGRDVTETGLEYAPLKFEQLVELQRQLGESEDPLVSLQGHDDPTDFTQTLMQAAALLGHSLAMHQDLYAREAYLSTAEQSINLIRHARRLAYQLDVGVSATGFVQLTVGQGLRGELPEKFQLSSLPRGIIKSQEFETLTSLYVDSDWNELFPRERLRPAKIKTDNHAKGSVLVPSQSIDIQPGQAAALLGSNLAKAVRVVSIERHADFLKIGFVGTEANASWSVSQVSMLSQPTLVGHWLGWDAPTSQFPREQLQTLKAYTQPTTHDVPSYGYIGPHVDERDLYLTPPVENSLVGSWLSIRCSGKEILAQVVSHTNNHVSLRMGVNKSIPTVTVVDSKVNTGTRTELFQSDWSAPCSILRLQDTDGVDIERKAIDLSSSAFGQWSLALRVVEDESNTAALTQPLLIDSDLGNMRPGRLLAFSTLDNQQSQIVEVRQIEVVGGGTKLWWDVVAPLSLPSTWRLGDLKIHGNVVRVSHGESFRETLGDSDGVTAFQRFELKRSPLTMLPSASGALPALEIQVSDITWHRVEQLADSESTDRHYQLICESEQKTQVLFGDGVHGAIPPVGKRNIVATYRHQSGESGNADRGMVSRIKRSHPLIRAANNSIPLEGGTNPADLRDIRYQATRHVRCFDRATSIQDYADLALMFPGVARASARWDNRAGILLVVASSSGQPMMSLKELRRFLDARRDVSVPLKILEPIAVDVHVTVTIDNHRDHKIEVVRKAVQDQLFDAESGLFTFSRRELGQPAHLSELFAVLCAVPGVEHIDIKRFSLWNFPEVYDVLEVSGNQWLRLQPPNCVIHFVQGGTA